NNLGNNWRDAYDATVSHLAFARISSQAISEEVAALKAQTAKILTEWSQKSAVLSATFDEAKGRIGEVDKALAAAREASAKEGVARQATEFEGEAGRCLIASKQWFGRRLAQWFAVW